MFVGKRQNSGHIPHCAQSLFLYSRNYSGLLKSQLWQTRKMFVYKIQVNPIYTILKHHDYYDFMDK